MRVNQIDSIPDTDSVMLERWATRGGKYTLELWQHTFTPFDAPTTRKVGWDIYESTNFSRTASSVNIQTFEGAMARLALYVSDGAIDGIRYTKLFPVEAR
jgi:hypothetical protein